jgi:hypothetical protein
MPVVRHLNTRTLILAAMWAVALFLFYEFVLRRIVSSLYKQYDKTQSLPSKKHWASNTTTIRLMLFRRIIFVHCENLSIVIYSTSTGKAVPVTGRGSP